MPRSPMAGELIVDSETGQLGTVILHCPGSDSVQVLDSDGETVRMVPLADTEILDGRSMRSAADEPPWGWLQAT